MHHRTVCLRSSSRNVPSALVGRLFLGRSPPRLLNAAAPSGLKPAPASRLREAGSHLQYSTRNFFRCVTHSCPQVFHRERDTSRLEVIGTAQVRAHARTLRTVSTRDPAVAPPAHVPLPFSPRAQLAYPVADRLPLAERSCRFRAPIRLRQCAAANDLIATSCTAGFLTRNQMA